jgi:hypothetical protein
LVHHMSSKVIRLATVISVLAVTSSAGVSENSAGTKVAPFVESAKASAAKELWEYPADIHTRDLFYGPGGKSHRPGSMLQFVKEDLGGSNPKFSARDENGVKWKVKMGHEARPETVAARLLWAVGYHADEDYFLASVHIGNVPRNLHRGGNQISRNGTVRNVRLERENKDRKSAKRWSWRKAPFERTREFNGLRVMMALMNNWDLKDENNTVFTEKERRVYEVSDLGATFGTTGVLLIKKIAKGNAHSYQHSKFITKTTPEYVDFATPSLPSLPYVFNPFQYTRRARLRWIGRHVSRSDAKWIGGLLAQLSEGQIQDAFRAAGYPPNDLAVFTRVVRDRIAKLNAL